ncbi:hypothetical protein BDV59DRAFT_195326 [Aspergillus ambiguus]|uniref:fungal specific transcription factor domain-containing protein n=1 Tax=Aspergillus ambiguus TaxID=176160 RepID=UPI003CCE0BF3
MATNRVLPAVRCDRQQACANCADAGVECRRDRAKLRSKQKPRSGNNFSPRVADATYESDREMPTKKRKLDYDIVRSKSVPGETAELGATHEDSTHRARQAKVILQNEMNYQNPLNEQPHSLRTGEFPGTNIQWPDHISGKTLERMVTRLLQHEIDEQAHHQLSICIYVKAISYVVQLSMLSDNLALKRQFLESKKLYEAAALHSLKHINVCSTPSLLLIQSLISGALLMQRLGKMNQSWVLNSYAARLIVSLNYHEVGSTSVSNLNSVNEEIYSSLWECYYLDRTLSSLFIRPPSLPELRVSPSQLVYTDTTLLYGPLFGIVLDLSQVQGELLDLSLKWEHKFSTQISATCEHLRTQMEKISSDLQSRRSSAPTAIVNEWTSADFCYYAVLVDVYRAQLRHRPDAAIYKECLLAARASLRAFQLLEKSFSYVSGTEDPYPSFLTWTVLLYPLSPFFVLFCNVIRETDPEDYNLLKEVTQSLSHFTSNSYVSKVLDLLCALQHLCEPLFQMPLGTPQGPPASETYHAVVSHTANDHFTDPVRADASDIGPVLEPPDNGVLEPGIPPGSSSSTDGLIWQLFNSQFSLDWFDMDYRPFDGH